MKKFGLVGKKLDYSYSKLIHGKLGELEKIELSYELIEVDDLSEVNFKAYDGLNITTPYKEKINKYTPNYIKICNTVDKNMVGYNTDIDGFKYLLKVFRKKIRPHEKIVIMGSGAMAKMIKKRYPANKVQILSRKDNSYDKPIKGDILINASPMGMGENYDQCLLSEETIKQFKFVIDLNYNPGINKLLYIASKNQINNINGLPMLVFQAVKAFEIWNDIKVSEQNIKKVYEFMQQKTTKGTALTGMPLSGKTNHFQNNGIKNALVKDTDKEIVKKINTSIKLYVEEHGIEKFRDVETEVIKELVESGCEYISLGGGVIERWENRYLLREYLIIDMTPKFKVLEFRFGQVKKHKRPLVQSLDDLKALYKKRQIKYKFFQNKEVFINGDINC